jgi:hypothetical protein
VVELTIALHKRLQHAKDKFVWDVSHQVYVHKILTGRKNRFRTIRQTDGLNGFALRTESEHDCFGAGHAGTALSAALGMAAARDKRGTDENVVCIFGDAALTNGISFEAMNNIATRPRNSSASSTTTNGASPKTSAPFPATSTSSSPIRATTSWRRILKFRPPPAQGRTRAQARAQGRGGFKGAITGVGLQQPVARWMPTAAAATAARFLRGNGHALSRPD